MLVSTSGGHFSTMRGLEPFWLQHDRVWVTDLKKDTEVLNGKEKVYWLPYQGPRQIIPFLFNIPTALRIVSQEQPSLILSTGASIAVNFAIAAKISGIKFVFIESISRSKELSLSGKLVYALSNEFYVQWPNLCDKYSKAIFKGHV
ncbi:putative glucosyltransferase EpsE homolog [Calothrix sp. NIES-4071]|nr:putative glucosyltransferase EpsE homolog [Calothrix sp. NIES-4071]BAZ55872.1 putative glucosyltransferase EpsE homolog [Calothrix sp. NIES-4105]